MLEPLLYPSTIDKPQVILDPQNNIFEIAGKSYPADVNFFYRPILNWFEKYAEDPNPETLFVMKMDYFNSSSAKKIVEIIIILSEIYKAGNNVKIIWHYQDHDETIQELGEDLKQQLDVPIELMAD